jgi:hypothetical protein
VLFAIALPSQRAIAGRGKLVDLKLTPHIGLPLDWVIQKRSAGIE